MVVPTAPMIVGAAAVAHHHQSPLPMVIHQRRRHLHRFAGDAVTEAVVPAAHHPSHRSTLFCQEHGSFHSVLIQCHSFHTRPRRIVLPAGISRSSESIKSSPKMKKKENILLTNLLRVRNLWRAIGSKIHSWIHAFYPLARKNR